MSTSSRTVGPRRPLALLLGVALFAGSCQSPVDDVAAPPTQTVPTEPTAAPTEPIAADTDTPSAPRLRSTFVLESDLAMWRARAEEGPFRTTGDVAPNSPGEWESILDAAEEFRVAPAAQRWRGPTENNPGGPVQPDLSSDSDPPTESYVPLVAAAFVSLVEDDPELRGLVADELVAQAAEPGVDFTDTDRWERGLLDDINPLFFVATWGSALLLAIDYVDAGDPAAFAPADRDRLDDWFHGLADLVSWELDWMFGRQVFGDWVTRTEPPFRPLPGTIFDKDNRYHYAHDGVGEVITDLGRSHNNRRAQMARYLVMAGLKLPSEHRIATSDVSPPAYREDGVKFLQSVISYGFWPDGWTSEMERGSRGASFAWSYTWALLAPMMTAAHLLAMHDDRRLLDHTSRHGWETSRLADEDPDKSLRRTILTMAGLTHSNQATLLFDGEPVDGLNIKGAHGLHDLGTLAVARLHYDDPLIERVLLRSAEHGLVGWPARGTSYRSSYAPFAHDWHIFPGSLFYFGAPSEPR